MYEMTVSESGESGNIQLVNERGETLPVVFHFFGRENIALYHDCTEAERLEFMKLTALQLVEIGLTVGGVFEDWVSIWNTAAAVQDKPAALEVVR